MFLIVNLWKPVGVFMTLGAWFAGFIKRITKHYYTQNMKALRLVVSEMKPSYLATNKIEKLRTLWFCRRRYFMYFPFSG